MPSAASRAAAAAASGFGGSRKTRKPAQLQVVLVGGGRRRCRRARAGGDGDDPVAGGELGVQRGRARAAGTSAQRARTASGRALGDQRRGRRRGPDEHRRPCAGRGRRAAGRAACSRPAARWPSAAGESHSAASSGLPPTAAAVVDGRPRCTAAQPQHRRRGPAVAGRAARMKLIRPSVSVPVLSVNSTSMSPRSSMHTSRLTSTLRRASRRDPVARLVDTTAGSSCGVMPTAMARENSSASRSGRCSTTLIDEDRGGEHAGDLDQQHREPAQPDLELGLGLRVAQAERRSARTRRCAPGGDHDAACRCRRARRCP